jgi:biopolymer transport protein ExbB/TolQ
MKQGEADRAGLARRTIDGSVFWGAYALALGILGTLVGFMMAAQAVEALGRVETPLVWGGVKVALSTTLYGLLIFLGAALLWLGLRHWHRRTVLGSA